MARLIDFRGEYGDGTPYAVYDTCELLIAAIPSRVHDPKKPGDLLKVGGDPLDDVMDSARYGLYSWVTAAEKPIEVRRAEMTSQFAPLLHDQTLSETERRAVATSLLIRQQQEHEEENAGRYPARIGRFGRR